MTIVLLSGALTFVVGILISRPFSVTRSREHGRAHDPDDVRRRELLRQLRDIDDDLAAGKLTQADHVRLRGPVEREAAAVLGSKSRGQAAATAVLTSSKPPGPASSDRRQTLLAPARAKGRRRWTGMLLALAGSAAGVTMLLISSASSRAPGQTITGDPVPGAATAQGSQSGSPSAAPSGNKSPTPRQLAAVAAAESQVKLNPKNVNAHLALANAYAAAGASQLAAIEYLAVTRIDPANAEANTSLALLAFEVGRPAQGKAMVDRVLAADPNYPEALYVRGLINLVGLRRPRAAERDFSAYLAAAPFGSHRTAAATMLVLAQNQDRR
ncbi:MAG: tetratricopeptide repeat protein [Streptosporangiaceae bacterium]